MRTTKKVEFQSPLARQVYEALMHEIEKSSINVEYPSRYQEMLFKCMTETLRLASNIELRWIEMEAQNCLTPIEYSLETIKKEVCDK